MSVRKDTPKESDSWREYLDIAGVIILVISADQTVRFINRKGCEILGHPEKGIVGRNWFDHFLPERLRADVRKVFEQLMAGEEESVEFFENPVLTRDGRERLIKWQNRALQDAEGNITGTLSSGEDISEQRRREEKLARRESELRAIVETAAEGIITIDTRGVVDSFNPAASRIFGYQPEEVVGRNVGMLMSEEDRKHHDRYIRDYLETGKARIIGIGREVTGRRRNGDTFPMHVAVSEVTLADRTMFTGIVRDLTDYKRMQEEMFLAQNLAAIGEMATTVAHEIKNPLAGIGGAIQVLQDSLTEDDSRQAVMKQVLEQVTRLDKFVSRLLTFAKPWKPEIQVYDVRKLLETVVDKARALGEFSGIEFVLRDRSPVPAAVDPLLLEQVLWNLLANAAQAMPGGGQVRCTLRDRPTGVSITLTDSGPGIPLAVRERLFRPFFTTRTHGVGLGLAVCRKIMSAHGGSIKVANAPAGGTRVTLQLPKPRPSTS